nr:MAG TPA: hypothetical protein [Caudoviricetes sp.]
MLTAPCANTELYAIDSPAMPGRRSKHDRKNFKK